MVFENTAEWVAFGGALAGVLYRTLYPYFEKVQEMESTGQDPVAFLHKYKITAVISLAVSTVTAMGIFSGINTTQGGSLGALFITAFTSGIGTNELLNRASYKMSEKKSRIETKAAQIQKEKAEAKKAESEESKPAA